MGPPCKICMPDGEGSFYVCPYCCEERKRPAYTLAKHLLANLYVYNSSPLGGPANQISVEELADEIEGCLNVNVISKRVNV